MGEAFFAIYPRPNQPRLKLSARRDEDWYRYSTVLALLRAGSQQPAMHCGRLAVTVSLREHRPPATQPSPTMASTGAQDWDQQAAASSPQDVPVPSHLCRTPESAYHSLPTESRARSIEVRQPKSGAQRSHIPAKQGQNSLLRTEFGSTE